MAIIVKKPGIWSSIQSLGHSSRSANQLAPAGPMDVFAASIANALLGQSANLPVLEFHFPGPEFLFEKDTWFSIAGADFDAHLNGVQTQKHQPIFAQIGSILSFKGLVNGRRSYLAVAGGFDPEAISIPYNFPLKKGDKLTTKSLNLTSKGPFADFSSHLKQIYEPDAIRFIPGSEWRLCTNTTQNKFVNSHFIVTDQYNHKGLCLSGANLEIQYRNEPRRTIIKEFGSIHLGPDGQLYIALSDTSNESNDPVLGIIIPADLPKVAQLSSMQVFRFEMVSKEQAEVLRVSLNTLRREIESSFRSAIITPNE